MLHTCVCTPFLRRGAAQLPWQLWNAGRGGQLILASQPRRETIGLEAPLAPMPWHIWKLLASTSSPTPPSLRQLFLVANSGKYPLVRGCLQRMG